MPRSRPDSHSRRDSSERTGVSICRGCAELYTTWRNARPRGCRAYGFETSAWPDAVVLETSGRPCSLRRERDGAAASQNPQRDTQRGGLYG